jgi:hypothetical protein
MANINRGEHALTIAEQEYTLVLTLNDLEELEEGGLNMGAAELFVALQRQTARASHIRAVLTKAFAKAKPRPAKQEIPLLLAQVSYPDRWHAALMLVAGGLNQLNSQQPQKENEPGAEPEQEEGQKDHDPLSATAA